MDIIKQIKIVLEERNMIIRSGSGFGRVISPSGEVINRPQQNYYTGPVIGIIRSQSQSSGNAASRTAGGYDAARQRIIRGFVKDPKKIKVRFLSKHTFRNN